MKLFEVAQLDKEMVIRNSIGRTLSAKSIAVVLNRVFDQNFSPEDTLPYVRVVNQAMENINSSDSTAVEQAKSVWQRIIDDLTHKKARPLPDQSY